MKCDEACTRRVFLRNTGLVAATAGITLAASGLTKFATPAAASTPAGAHSAPLPALPGILVRNMFVSSGSVGPRPACRRRDTSQFAPAGELFKILIGRGGEEPCLVSA